MLRMFKDSIENKKLPETLYSANIALILKKDKDSTEPSCYGPISLLGSDIKIFTKILANRLSKCISSIIHEDQTGFMPPLPHFSQTIIDPLLFFFTVVPAMVVH